MMPVKDYSKCYKDENELVDLSPLAPVWPFRLLVVGPSGCGKTNMLTDLLLNHIYYDKIYIFAKELEEGLYMFLKQFFKNAETLEACEAFFFDSLEDIPDINEFDKSKQTLMVFDDFVAEKNQCLIEEIYLRGRKRNISSVYLSQSYFDTPPLVRGNSQYFAIFALPEKKQVRAIADTHSLGISFKNFKKIYDEVIADPYNFLLIDKKTIHQPLKFRKNWDGLAKPDIFY